MRYSQEDDYDDEEEINKNSFNNDDDNDDDGTERQFRDFDDEMDYMEAKINEQGQKIKIIKLAIQQHDLRRKILLDSIKFSQSSFWWKFCSWKTRLTWVSDVYERFCNLIFGEPDDMVDTEEFLSRPDTGEDENEGDDFAIS